MNIAVCLVAVAPVRREAGHRSEMTSQLLFGEFAEILERVKDFTKVRCIHDSYEGWVQTSQLVKTEETDLDKRPFFTSAWCSPINVNNTPTYVSYCTPVVDPEKNVRFGKYEIQYGRVACLEPSPDFTPENISRLSRMFLNTAYLWGGRSVFGVDCSGLSQQVFKLLGIALPRDAYQQAERGEMIGFLAEARCGDLAFFDNEEGRITHVGILLNEREIIHSSGRVRIDAIDHQGIVQAASGLRTHRLRLIKRYA